MSPFAVVFRPYPLRYVHISAEDKAEAVRRLPVLLTRLEGLTAQLVNSQVNPAFAKRFRWLRSAREEEVEQEDRVGDVDRAAVVGVSTPQAGRFLSATEQMLEDADGVRDVAVSVGVGIATAEAW